jgi:hypothetical protein
MDIEPNKAVEYIMKHSAEFAQAKADRIYIENFLRSKKSLLMAEAKSATISGAEAEAYAHPEYIRLIVGLKEAIEKEEKLKWMLTAAQLKVDIWRTEQATNRAIDSSVR